MRLRKTTAGVVAVALAGGGCASMNRTEKGGVIGAGAGGAVGAVVGHVTGSTVRGAIIGAVVGGAAGALIGRRMDQQAEKMAREIPAAKVSRVGEGIAVTFDSGILFPFDSSTLEPAGRENLRKLAASLQEEPRSEVLIAGHTDGVGREDYNQGLSRRRAEEAASYLAAQGVARSRIRTEGRGEDEPIASNDTDEGRRQNRRVELAVFAGEEWREEAKRQAGAD
ncbi:MAG TPA: OmpA family protein [Vicinamibacteria bacterium]|nr:OmpA family protein [Vicinamibacteria bacterium]